MVLYRKYRPQKIADLDIKEVREKLEKTLASNYRPHAYLFAGPKGTGKTSAARIIAKILNCEKLDGKSKEYEPCNNCDSCQAITDGRHFDILEIDAASNRGIEEIRDLREKIKLAPVSGKFKTYIIDEVHMLTTEAFNALLKTLEEPPLHAVFVLATTEPDRMPGTIKSRCVTFPFRKATREEVVHSLNRVIRGEGVKLDTKIINEIAEVADGSFRDATKILEQVLSEKIDSIEKLHMSLGRLVVSPEVFLWKLKEKKVRELLQMIVEMGSQGADFRFFVTSLLNLLHALLLAANGLPQTDVSEKMKGAYTSKEISELIRHFSDVYQELRFISRPELPLETAVVAWCEK
ncbi:MAG: polymerase III subunit gamma and tau, DNA polymerase III subunit gamma/tau protein [Candidatus Gottesmanbacteria bacterium GW2011_GWA2_43_14]|uniref:DNA polymerase III subunit gamma/tau n=1 Tax=Candidatus Gottesmanbacteria bacterium GW2011_GWA2_43_14 TaxID=1618443 RepID=A0A0G1GFJ8_9BACT|nr:MAG: polymerase III subunit gamma and tau, DNA polymerase III subunit gamma/tau protein [Candidatus Gottesmanbacteria bacterium GW2011_GWA2_43_14]